jgi:PAS domain S-box-containing protein
MQAKRKPLPGNGSAMTMLAVSEFERVLRRKHESYRSLVEAAPDIVYAMSVEDETIIFLNDAFEKITGCHRSDWIGQPFISWVHPEDRQRAGAATRTLLKGDTVSRLELRVASKRDGYIVVEIGAVPEIEEGKVLRIFGFAREVTDRKRIEEQLHRSADKHRSIIESMQEGYYEIDLNGVFTYFNESLCRILGYSRDELLAVTDRHFIDDETARKVYRVFEEVYSTGEPCKSYCYPITRKDGAIVYVEISISLIRTIEGRANGFRGVIRDVTNRMLTEEALRESEGRYRGLANSAFDGILIHHDRSIKSVNRHLAAMFGYTVEELLGNDVLDLTPPQNREFIADRIGLGTEDRYETLGLRKDGTPFDIEVSAMSCVFGGKPCRLVVVRDITAPKRAEKELRESGERYRLMFERNLSGICRATLDGQVLDCNEAFATIFGYTSREEVLAEGTLGLYGNSRDRNDFLARLREHQTLNNLELYLIRRDGTRIWVLGNVSLVADDIGSEPVIEGIWMDITERKLTEEELKSSRELLRALSAELQVIREEERTHIAREIHDQLGQALTRLKIDLALMADDLPEDGKHLLTRTSAMSKLFDETIQNVRRICSELRPSSLDHLGLTAAIEEELREWHERTGIEYEFVSLPENLTLDAERSTAIFRILQEALTNVARHTDATRVDVALTNKGGYVYLRISDNGNGIPDRQVYNPKSLGLIGMRERALQWGGKFEIRRAPTGGTSIELVIPLRRFSDLH